MVWPLKTGSCLLYLSTCLLIGGQCLTTEEAGSSGRGLLQAKNLQGDEVTKILHPVQESLAKIKIGSVLSLRKNVFLETPLVIDKSVTLRGRSGGKKIAITCTHGNAALDLRSSGIVLQNLIIRNCSAPAVMISNQLLRDSGEAESVNVTLSQMEFYDNTARTASANGGALYIGKFANVTIIKSIFEDNVASNGGAIYAMQSDLLIQDCEFRRNKADRSSGGAIHVKGLENSLLRTFPLQPTGDAAALEKKTLRVVSSIFEANVAAPGNVGYYLPRANGGTLEVSTTLPFQQPSESGGAIFSSTHNVVAEACTFRGNRASTGGAMFLMENDVITLSNCHFFDNHLEAQRQDIEQGGAVYILSLKVKIRDCTFKNNTGVLGGALHVLVPFQSATVNVESSTFIANRASSSGGAALIRNGDDITWSNCTFIRNVAQSGGALMLTNGVSSRFEPLPGQARCQFLENMAMDGGAVHCLGAGSTVFEEVFAHGNTALRNGGALALVNSLAGAHTQLLDGEYENNTACRGGAVYSDGIVKLDVRSKRGTVFKNNTASTGGGMYMAVRNPESNKIEITDAIFIGNRAAKDVEISRKIVKEVASTVKEMGGQYEDIGHQELIDADLAGCGIGGGGGICLGVVSVPERALVDIKLLDSIFRDNEALNGGGLHVRLTGGRWTDQCSLNETPLSFSRCKSLSMTGCNFTDNAVHGAGGSLFVNRPADLFVDCQPHALLPGNKTSLALMPTPCANWTGKLLDVNGYGDVVASVAKEIRLSPRNEILTNHTSGKELPPIKLEVADAFGQVIKSGIKDTNFSVSARSNFVRGQLDTTAHKGIAAFNSLVVTAPPGTYTVTFSGDHVKSTEVNVTIRQCYIGEEIICPGQPVCVWGSHTGCQVCEKDFYSFNPNISCHSCPENALCTGGAALIPRPGYWHSSPFSPFVQECLYGKACSYEGRSKALRRFYDDQESLVALVGVPENYTQCREGYQGVLCGSCKVGYGRMGRGECAKCKEDKSGSIAIISTIAFWALILVAIGIKSALNTTRDLKDMQAVAALRTMNAAGERIGNPLQVPPSPMRIHQREIHHFARSSIASIGSQSALIPEHHRNHTMDLDLPEEDRYADIDHITASEDMSEAAKILVNFLQVTSIAVAINVEWTNFIQRLLEAQDIAAGFSNGSGVISLDCVLSDNPGITRSIASLVMRLSFPFMILVTVLLFFLSYWSYLRWKGRKSVDYLVSRSIICVLCILFFTYALVTKDLVKTVNCISVDSDVHPGKLYHEYAISQGKYWGEDTSLKCFEGEHAVLAFGIGIPGLILISFGAPLYLAYFLNKNKARLSDRDFLNTYGFAYQAYKEKNVYWDALVMARKGIIGAVVVFAYPLGGNLQGVLALGILLLALILQLLVQPFRNTKLNFLEAGSLVVSALTFYFGIMFNDPKTSTEAEVAFSALLFLVMVFFVLAAVYQVYVNLDCYMLARLRHLKVKGVTDNWGFWKKTRKLAFAELELEKTGEVMVELGRTLTQKVHSLRSARSTPKTSDESGDCSASITSTGTVISLDQKLSPREVEIIEITNSPRSSSESDDMS